MPCGYRAPRNGRGPTCRWSGADGTRRCLRASVCASRPSTSRCAGRAKRHLRRSFGALPKAARLKAAPDAPCGWPTAPIHENPARPLARGRQIPRARLRPDPGRALLRAQRQAPARLHLLAGLQLSLRVLLRPVRLRPQVGGPRADAHGDAIEGAVGPIPF